MIAESDYSQLWMSPYIAIKRMATISETFGIERARTDGRFKKEREAWTTGVFALALSKLNGEQWWIEIETAKRKWPQKTNKTCLHVLEALTRSHRFSIADGDLILVDNGWYVTHAGLLRLARRSRCAGIDVKHIPALCSQETSKWVFRAAVYKTRLCRGFVGHGDANPSNVSPLVRGAEMRVAETRAVNRALRKAYGIGICSVEELGSRAERRLSSAQSKKPPQTANGSHGGPKLRDYLCQLIRQHQLDPNLVKAYAVDFCGTQTLREATREQVQSFVAHLADRAEKDRNSLLCQLNSYLPSKGSAA